MPTPAQSSTSQSSLEDAPLQPLPISSPTHHAGTARSATSSSHHTAAQAISTSRPHRGYATYRPRPSSSSLSLRESSRSSARGRWPTSMSRSVSRSREPELDNWNILSDLVGDPEQDEDDATVYGTTDTVYTPRIAGGMSARSLRSFFSIPSEELSRPVAVSKRSSSSRREENGDTIAGILSTSPSAMNGLEAPPSTILERTSEEEDGRGDQDRPGKGASDSLLAGHARHRESGAAPSLSTPATGQTQVLRRQTYWPPSPVAIAIFKCALSYLIASLFTFVPSLAKLLSTSSEIDAHGRVTPRPAYSAHMVATIVVYFNPAKTVGHMLLADRFCLILALLATAVSLCSMLTLHLFDHFSPSQGSSWDWISEIGDWVVCVLWIGGSMGLLAWSKVWVGNPSFNSGCSMAAVTIYTVVIKEGAVPKLLEVLLIVLIGALITNLVCYLVFPMTATTRLQTSISRSLQSFSTLLDLLTSTFLLKKNAVKDSRLSLKAAVASHASAFTTLKTDLAEAKNERLLDGRIRGRKLELYDAAIGSLTRLAQHLAGLRGSTRLSEGLIRASREGKVHLDLEEPVPGQSGRHLSVMLLDDVPTSPGPGIVQDLDIQASVKLFLQFRNIAGHQMDALVDNCDDALEAVQSISSRKHHDAEELTRIRSELGTALKEFNKCSSTAIKRLYAGPRRAKGIYEDSGSDSSSESGRDHEHAEIDAESFEGPNETVFLIYFFLFTLEEFARELLFLLDTFSEILGAERISTKEYVKSLWPTRRGRKEKRADYLYKQFRSVVPVDPSQLQPPLFPRNKRDGRSSLVSDEQKDLTAWTKAKQRFWAFGDWLRRPNVRYAIKTGLGGAILAAPAYTEAGRPIFLEYRGEWALIAYFGAISPTVGQTNFLSFFRVVGTMLGAAVAVIFYTIFPENPVMLPILGVIFSLPCFYVITQMPAYAQAGRFTLLTYNLTCLYAYNSREKDLTVFSIAYHRSTSVIIGVIWAAVVSRYWWPFTARRELRMGLSDFCLDLSYLYSKLVTTYSRGADLPEPEPSLAMDQDEQEPLLPIGSTRHPHLNAGVRQFMAMELHLQGQLSSLRDLLAQTRNEPRLKGPFAFDFYHEVLLSCERMLDRLHSMRCVTTRDEWDNGIRTAFVAPVNKQRREMVGNVILYFYTLSAGFRLRTPMPPYLPPAEHARQRLVEALRGLDVVKRRSVRGGGRHLLFFAYALAMQEVIAELEYLGTMMQDAFGVISQSTVVDFESLFEPTTSVLGLAPGVTMK